MFLTIGLVIGPHVMSALHSCSIVSESIPISRTQF
jgi:hypothetical protein